MKNLSNDHEGRPIQHKNSHEPSHFEFIKNSELYFKFRIFYVLWQQHKLLKTIVVIAV